MFLGISMLLAGPALCLAADSLIENPVSSHSGDFIDHSCDVSYRDSCMEEQQPACGYDQRLQIGGNYTYCWISPEGSSTVSGNLGGAQGIYEYRPLESIYAGAAFSYRIGTTSNDIGTRKLQDFNPQARVGYTFSNANIVDRLSVFTGFGARYMAETVSIGSASLDFDYTTFYVPLGFLLERTVVNHFLIGCNFQWMPQVLPMVRIDLLDGAQWDLTYQLLNFFVEVPFTFSACDDRYTISICPYFETWRDGASTAETLTALTLSLPGNKYIFTGVNVNFGFSY
jgi:hypothetical protein